MILNPWTVSSLFLAAVGLALAASALAVGLRGAGAASVNATRAASEAGEDRGHLLVLIVGVLALVRLLAWPQFYLLLKSYVPELAPFGVMCAFGVTRIEPTLVAAIELSKPLALFGFGFWWLLVLLDRSAGGGSVARARNLFAVALALCAAGECALEIAYVLREKVGHPVTCCTQFLDTAAASGAAPERNILGGNLALYCAVNALAVGFAFAASRAPQTRSRWRASWSALSLAVLAALNLCVTYATWVAVVAPSVLGLPYHHCVYELLTDTPALGLAALLACAGGACAIWPLGLAAWKRRAPEQVERLQSSVYAAGALATASSMFIVLVHLM